MISIVDAKRKYEAAQQKAIRRGPLRWGAGLAGLALCYAEPWTDAVGLSLAAAILAVQLARPKS